MNLKLKLISMTRGSAYEAKLARITDLNSAKSTGHFGRNPDFDRPFSAFLDEVDRC